MKRICVNLNNNRNSGFATVYLLVILSSLIAAVIVMINIASGYAARSIVDNVCAVTGRSVLSEYQKDLFRRYGLFALRSDEAILDSLAEFYINGSLNGRKALVSPSAEKITVNAENYPALDVERFGEQVKELAPATAILKGDILEFIMSNADEGPTGLVKQISETTEDSEEDSEAEPKPEDPAEKVIDDPEGEAGKEFDKDEESSRKEISPEDIEDLPSALLGYHQRLSALLSGGIKDISFSTIIEDEYIMAVCSNKCHVSGNTFLDFETEYVIYGRSSDAANLRNVKLSLFAIRFAVNEAKYYSETGELLSATALSVAKSVGEVRNIIAGQKVDKLDYNMYLRILLALIPRDEKMARLMDVMQLNIRKIDGADFLFRNYAYGFELSAVFDLNGREGDVVQEFVYQ